MELKAHLSIGVADVCGGRNPFNGIESVWRHTATNDLLEETESIQWN